jgi:hypothetical protein
VPESPTGQLPDNRGPILFMVMLAIAGLITVAWGLGRVPADDPADPATPASSPSGQPRDGPSGRSRPHKLRPDRPSEQPDPSTSPDDAASARSAQLPGGGTRIFGHHRFLVAYYGTARTGALGVLGETGPGEMARQVMRAARPFRRAGEQIQPVYELIVTVADRVPGRDRDYSHDIGRDAVQRFVDAAHRHGAILLLDLQPGRSRFPEVAKRWAWALQHPWVGLALDPEWRVGPRQVPARVVGRVGAPEVNATSAWLERLTRRADLPEKLFVLHQFRSTMVTDIGRVRDRPNLAFVLHADGFGTRRQKLATYHFIARPHQFTMGFKLFYDEDVRRFDAAEVRRIRPPVRFVSYQ